MTIITCLGIMGITQFSHAQINLNDAFNVANGTGNSTVTNAAKTGNDEGIKTTLHKNNLEKVVFSNNLIAKDCDDPSVLKTDYDSFTNGIYARIYMKKSLDNAYISAGKYGGSDFAIEFWVDGKKINTIFDGLEGSDAKQLTSFYIVLAPNNESDAYKQEKIMQRFAYVASAIPSGKHTIKLKVTTVGADAEEAVTLLGEGEFTINITESDRDQFVTSYGYKLKSRGLLDTQTGLEAEVKKLCHPSVTTIRCPVSWEMRYDNYGNITHRVTRVDTGYKDDDGNCKAGAFVIQQVKTSSGWGKAEISPNESVTTWGVPDAWLPCQNFTLTSKW